MANKVTYTFDVEIERNDDEEEDRRYQAYCGKLTGCRVYASTEEKALGKMKQAIDIWLGLADLQLTDDPESVEERIDSLLD